MPSTVSGDFSKYPPSIREVFPILFGESCELRQAYDVYFYLFMAKKERTEVMADRLGGVLGIFQNLLQDEIFLSIARLTDKHSSAQKNICLSALLASISDEQNAGFASEVTGALDQICQAADNVRKHRHKRIAHFDLSVSVKVATLPVVTFTEIFNLINQIESFLNIFSKKFANTSILFDAFSSRQITHKAEVTSYKALTYDLLEAEGVIARNEWKKRMGI
jgi:hypothetical protein